MIFSPTLHLTLDNLEKGLSEGLIEERVEERVDHGGRVAQPGHQVDDLLADVGAARDEHVRDEERRPQQHEREEDDAEDLRERKER